MDLHHLSPLESTAAAVNLSGLQALHGREKYDDMKSTEG